MSFVVVSHCCKWLFQHDGLIVSLSTDCGLSVSWEPDEDTRGCDKFSPASIKDRWIDPENEVQQSLVGTVQGHRLGFKIQNLTMFNKLNPNLRVPNNMRAIWLLL